MEAHIHTRFSKDSLLPLWLLYFKCRIKKIDVVAITDHNCVDGAKVFKRRYGKKIKTIIGEEIMTSDGEIIGLFIHDLIKPYQSPAITVNEIMMQHGLVYIPHPYDRKRSTSVLAVRDMKAIAESIDCMECHNGRNISSDYSIRQNEIAESCGVCKIIGSDAHTASELGRNYMTIPDDSNMETSSGFHEALQYAVFHKAECMKFVHEKTRIIKMMKLAAKGDLHEIYRIIHQRFAG